MLNSSESLGSSLLIDMHVCFNTFCSVTTPKEVYLEVQYMPNAQYN